MDVIANAEANIRQAIRDYGAHTRQTEVLDDVSDRFIERLARDNANSKKELRELFSKSPAWDERLDALVINGTRTHNPDPQLIFDLAKMILNPALNRFSNTADYASRELLTAAIDFFVRLESPSDGSIAAIKCLAPKAYAPNKKPSRIFKGLCDALGVSDDTAGSNFQKLYAQFADELTAKKIGFKLYVSLNPAHFITMSNPKSDSRGSTLTSCHSFNSTEYDYNGGCVGYARDKYSFIVFTAADPKVPETLNNRKTTRQTFAYKPGNGLLMQSRLYNTSGGTSGAQEESKLYRDLVQREISELEGMPNLWKTKNFLNEMSHTVRVGDGFCGYCDWTYEGFEGKVSIRADHEDDYETLTVGTYGLCVYCGDSTSSGVYCGDCKGDRDHEYHCDDCGDGCDETYTVHDSRGHEIYVCEDCRDRHYTCCERCDEYFHEDCMTDIGDGYVCESCRDEYYDECSDCGDWSRTDDMYRVFDSSGDEVDVCRDCRDDHYVTCEHCDELVHEDNTLSAHDINGNDIIICDDCRDKHFEECDECGGIFDSDTMVDGRCPNCYVEDEEESEEIA